MFALLNTAFLILAAFMAAGSSKHLEGLGSGSVAVVQTDGSCGKQQDGKRGGDAPQGPPPGSGSGGAGAAGPGGRNGAQGSGPPATPGASTPAPQACLWPILWFLHAM